MLNSSCINYKMERTLEDADGVRRYFGKFLLAHGVDSEALACIELTIYEIVVNIIEHGDIISGDGTIDIMGELVDHRFSCTFLYSGSEYNLNEHRLPNLKDHVKRGSKDGLGIYITRKFMDEIEYSHENGENRLTIVKLLH